MNGPYKHQLKDLNAILSVFAETGVGVCGQIEADAELVKILLSAGYIEPCRVVTEYSLAQVPGTGMVDVPTYAHGHALTPKGKQFHLDGGYRRADAAPTKRPKKKPGPNANAKRTFLLAVVSWFKEHPVGLLLVGLGFFVFRWFWLWVDKNWDGHWSIASFKSLFGLSP